MLRLSSHLLSALVVSSALLACGDGDLQRIGSYAAAVFRVG